MVALDSSEGGKSSLQLAISLVNQIPGGELILSHVKKDPSGKSMQDYTADAEKDPVVAEAAAKAKKWVLSIAVLLLVVNLVQKFVKFPRI